MGEIARRVIVECVKLGCLFNGQLSDELNTPHRFYTKYVSEIEKYDCLFTMLSVCNFLLNCVLLVYLANQFDPCLNIGEML